MDSGFYRIKVICHYHWGLFCKTIALHQWESAQLELIHNPGSDSNAYDVVGKSNAVRRI